MRLKTNKLQDNSRAAKEEPKLTQMAENIALRTKFFRDLVPSLDLVEQGCRWVLEEVGEEVEATAVGHAC